MSRQLRNPNSNRLMAKKAASSPLSHKEKVKKNRADAKPGLLKKQQIPAAKKAAVMARMEGGNVGGRGATNGVTRADSTRRTKRMIAADTGLNYDEIYVDDNLRDDLNYSDSNIRALEMPIERSYFNDVDADANPEDLVKATTVGGLSTIIYEKAVPVANQR